MAIHREIFILAGHDHPNLMRLFEVIDTKTHVNLLIELCSGLTLSNYIRSNGAANKTVIQTQGQRSNCFISEAKSIFREIVTAVAYMHELGLIHKGLTTDNIMIDEKGTNIKIIDFSQAISY